MKTKEECCDKKWKNRIETKRKKTAKVIIYEEPCTLPRLDVIPRHCLSKDEWINMLAIPSRKCPSPCKIKKIEERPLRPVSARMNQLALPPRNRMLATLQDRGTILPAELVDKLIQVLEAESCLSPEQAENLFHDKEIKKKAKIKKNTSDKKLNCNKSKTINQDDQFLLKSSAPVSPEFDEKAVNCQYSMAMEFVKSILQWKSEIPKEEFQDISDIIVKRLENILEYQVVDSGDRMTQQMKFLSDIVASWIAGVLFEVAELQKEELEKECDEKRQGKMGSSSDDSDDDDDDDSEKEIVLMPRPELLAKLKKEKEPKKEKEESKGQIGDSYTRMKIKKEDKSDDEDGDGVVEGGSRSPEQTPQQNDTAGGSPQVSEEKISNDGKDEGETDNLDRELGSVNEDESKNDNKKSIRFDGKESKGGIITDGLEKSGDSVLSSKEIKSENMSRASRNRVGFAGVPEDAGRPDDEEEVVLGESDSIEEIPQEPKLYETITIDDEGDNEPGFEPVRQRVKEEPELMAPSISKIKIEKKDETFDESMGEVKKESGLEGPLVTRIKSEKIGEDLSEPSVAIKKEPGLEEPLVTQIKLEKTEEDLSGPVAIKKEPRLKEPLVSQIKSEKIGEEGENLSEPVAIKKEPGLEGLTLSQIKQEIKQEPPLSQIKSEKIDETDSLTRTIKQEPGVEKLLPVSQIKSEKIEEIEKPLVQEIKPEPGLSGPMGANIKTERIEEESGGFAQVKIEPGVLESPEIKIKTEKVEGDLIQEVEKTEVIDLPVNEVKKPEVVGQKMEELIKESGKSEMVEEKLGGVVGGREKSGDKFLEKSRVSEIKLEKSQDFGPESVHLPEDKVKVKMIDEKLKDLIEDSEKSGDKLYKKSRASKIKSENLGLDKSMLEKNKEEMKFPLFPELLLSKNQDDDKLQIMADLEKILKTDVPFVNFLKIFKTLESVLEKKNINLGDDLMTNRLHRAVYKKFENIVRAESPDELTNDLKEMLNILSGKISLFLRDVLTDTEILFLEKYPAQVESFELREISKWMQDILNMADVWSTWLQKVINEANEISKNPTTRDDWNKWTNRVQTDALNFHKFYLESRHQAQHNRVMLSGRHVVKTGKLNYPPDYEHTSIEHEIKTTNLWN